MDVYVIVCLVSMVCHGMACDMVWCTFHTHVRTYDYIDVYSTIFIYIYIDAQWYVQTVSETVVFSIWHHQAESVRIPLAPCLWDVEPWRPWRADSGSVDGSSGWEAWPCLMTGASHGLNGNLVGGWATPLKNMSLLGWWDSQYMGK